MTCFFLLREPDAPQLVDRMLGGYGNPIEAIDGFAIG